MDTRSTNLPDDMFYQICCFNYSIGLLSRSMFTIFQQEQEVSRPRRLIEHAAKGNQERAEHILKRFPELLLTKDPIQKMTAFQASLRVLDVEMWEMMDPYFQKIPNGATEKIKQFKEEFPEYKLIQQHTYNFFSIAEEICRSSEEDIINALQHKNNLSLIYQALEKFRKDFTEISEQEKPFNFNHFVRAWDTFNTYYFVWTWPKRNLFQRQVIGFIERFFPVWLIQAIQQNIHFTLQNQILSRKSPRHKTWLTFPGRLGYDISRVQWNQVGLIHTYYNQKIEKWNRLRDQCHSFQAEFKP